MEEFEDDGNEEEGPDVQESDDEIIESDIELEGDILEPDNDPPETVVLMVL